jgi:quinol monooxygenase YgiN
MAFEDNSCIIGTYFKIQDGKEEEFKGLCERLVEKTQRHTGCFHCSFSFNSDESYWHQVYRDAEAAIANLPNVGQVLQDMTEIADVVRLEMHARQSELPKLSGFSELQPHYFTIEYGFRR